MANKENAFFNVTKGWTGVQPAMKYEYFAPVGIGRIEKWEDQGREKDDAIAYLNTLLRQPGTPGIANLFTNSRSRGLLARTGYTHLLRPVGRKKAKRDPWRYLSRLGTNHRSVPPRDSEKNLNAAPMLISPLPAGSASDRRTVD